MAQYFFPLPNGERNGLNIVQAILNMLASLRNLDFIAMSAHLNSAKGFILNSSANETLTLLTNHFQWVLLGVLEMNVDPMFTLMDRTNTRIYRIS